MAEKEKDVSSDILRNTPPFDPVEFSEEDPLALNDEVSDWEALVAERDDLKDRLIRALAEAENIRKRGERDRRDAETYGGSKLARDLLSVYDNMKRAVESIDDGQRETSKALIDGIELTQRELLASFSRHKIDRIAPEPGEKFNPQIHQAMFEAPAPGIKAGHIIQTLSEGFMIGERLLRPAHVGLSSTPAAGPAPDEPTQ